MDAFDSAYLLCLSDDSTSNLSELHQLSFIPGPTPVRGKRSSVDIDTVPEWETTAIRNALLGLPDMTEVTLGSHPALHMFEWRQGTRSLLLELEEAENPDWPFWSGCEIRTNCTFIDLLTFWLGFASQIPSTWLHNSNCVMYSPEVLVAELALPRLQAAFDSDDELERDRASRVREQYRALVTRFSRTQSD
jgi:hypothetical protein